MLLNEESSPRKPKFTTNPPYKGILDPSPDTKDQPLVAKNVFGLPLEPIATPSRSPSILGPHPKKTIVKEVTLPIPPKLLDFQRILLVFYRL